MCQFTVSLYLKPHMLYTCVFSCNLPPALLAEWLGSVTYYCGNRWGWGLGGDPQAIPDPRFTSTEGSASWWNLKHLHSGPALFMKPHEVKTVLLAENILSWKCCCWSLLYSAILRSRADSLLSHVILHEWLAFYSTFLNYHQSGVLTALFYHCFQPPPVSLNSTGCSKRSFLHLWQSTWNSWVTSSKCC